MTTYYLAIPKDAVGKGQVYLSKEFFGKQKVNAEKFGWGSVVFYTDKPDLK